MLQIAGAASPRYVVKSYSIGRFALTLFDEGETLDVYCHRFQMAVKMLPGHPVAWPPVVTVVGSSFALSHAAGEDPSWT